MTSPDRAGEDEVEDRPGGRVERRSDGRFELRLTPEERELVRTLPDQLREVLDDDADPALSRLFPVGYRDDPAREEEFRELVHDDLVSQRRGALDLMAGTIDAAMLEEEELLGWLGCVNDARLVLGSRLEVTEDLEPDEVDPDDPRAAPLAYYGFLTWLEVEIVEGLSA
jgi:uncharacterized protein DUF2017